MNRYSKTYVERTINAVILSTVLWVAGIAPAYAVNLLNNSAFDVAGPEGLFVIKPVPDGNGVTAAQDWSAPGNTPGATITELLSSTLVDGGAMIHVITDGDRNGLAQVFGDFDTGPATAYACVWVYLVSGSVGIGIGNGGDTNGDDMVLNKTGSWEVLQVSNGHSPVNTIAILSLGGGAEYYVESARVDVNRHRCQPK